MAVDVWYSSREMRGLKADNLNLYCPYDVEGDWDIPRIHATYHVPQNGVIGFNFARTSVNYKKGVHCFLYDYVFNGLWTDPDKYIQRLQKFDCFFAPDFSLYTEMSHAQRIWNIYRSRLLGSYFQSRDIEVIPTASWNESDTYDYCFDGLPKGGTIAVSSQGCRQRDDLMNIYRDGIKELIARKHPDTILVYGTEVDADYGDSDVIVLENEYLREVRRESKKKQRAYKALQEELATQQGQIRTID